MKKTQFFLFSLLAALLLVLVWQQVSFRRALDAQSTGDGKLAAELRATNDVLAELTDELKSPSSELGPATSSVDYAVRLARMSNPEIRIHAAAVLGSLGGAEAEAELVRLARKDAEKAVRAEALQGLVALESKELAPVLFSILDGSDMEQKVLAARLLVKNPSRTYTKKVVDLLRRIKGDSSEHASVRQALVEFLKKTADADACPALVDALRDEVDVRRAHEIAEALSVCATRKDLPLLLDAVKARMSLPATISAQDPLVALIGALARMNDLRATETIARFAGSKNAFVLRAAIMALVNSDDPAAAPALVTAYETVGSYNKIRIEAAFRKGFPGVNFDETAKAARLVAKEEMDSLLEAREAKMARRSKGDSPRD